MERARPLTNDEIRLVADRFSGTFAIHNRSLFMLGVSVGSGINGLLALTIGDVWKEHRSVKDLWLQKNMAMDKDTARMVPVNADARQAIVNLIEWHKQQCDGLSPEHPLFTSRKGEDNAAIMPRQAHKILQAPFVKAGFNGKLAIHTLRKSFAQRVYDGTDDT